MAINILHLSDVHLGTIDEADNYFSQLASDLTNNRKIKQLDYLVISGDIANRSTQQEYEAAFQIVEKLVKEYRLDYSRIVVVPGNHDLNWDLSENSYKFVSQRQLPKFLPEKQCIDAGEAGKLVRNEEKYKERFKYFSEHFYTKIYNKPYPQEYRE